MNTHEGCADPRATIGAIAIKAIVGLEAKLGMSIFEYAAQKDHPGGLKRGRHVPANAIYCFRLLDCGRWLPLNKFYMPLGHRGPGSGDPSNGYEAYAHRAVEFPTDPHELVDVWCSDNGHTLYFYDGNPASLKSYYVRFARLAAIMCPWRASSLPQSV